MHPILLPQLTPNTLEEIEWWILEHMPPYAVGAVLGMSGGIDSSVVAGLTARAFRRAAHQPIWEAGVLYDLPAPYRMSYNLRAYSLPSKTNKLDDTKDAYEVAEQFGISIATVRIGPMLDAIEDELRDTLGDCGLEGNLSAYNYGNMASRVRANVLWTFAAHHKSIVMGTGNKDEDYGVGYYTLLGDGAVHLNPIGCLSKRLVREAGKRLKLPDRILNRNPTAGLEVYQTDFTDLGYSYEFVELIMEGIEQGFVLNDLAVHPQVIAEWDVITNKWANMFGNKKVPFPLDADGCKLAIFDVLNRHEIALRKAEYIRPKVPSLCLGK